ncbi:MAG TPA: ARMT1-like domain-containing protein [Polyangiaceae bacterium]|nr:ARMT1-like domain-containing protein [Polyangiaceae bacterium]
MRPPPIRTDGSNAFARFSMQERVPRIARDVLAHNPDYPADIVRAVEGLASAIEANAPLPPARPPGPAVPAWTAADSEHAGESWLGTEWFFAELAFYRELVRACRFWETGRDPFAPVKDEELSGRRPWSRLEAALDAAASDRVDAVASLLEACLWGNRVDLSYTIAAERTERQDDDLLVDERASAARLLAKPGARVHFVADNAGTELALDLALVDALLGDASTRVTLHVKIEPVFVSDAMPSDVWRLLERMHAGRADVSSIAARIESSFAEGRLELAPDPFWSGPSFLWRAPAHLRRSFASATVVVIKGDANYRRLVGDAMWPTTTTLPRACGYMPVPLVCVRTLKSDPVLGLRAGLAERLDVAHPSWRVDGRHGVVQTYVPDDDGVADG